MKVTNQKLISNAKATKVVDVFGEIADLLIAEGSVKDKKALVDGFKAREAQGSTALGEGFAIPHTVNADVKEPKVVVLKKANVSDWETLDGSKVDTVIGIIVPKNGRDDHLTILSKLSGKLANGEFSKKIKTGTAADVEKNINSITEEAPAAKKATTGNAKIVAVTSCPTGIAHTYMAAEYLQEAGKELGFSVKVETQGQTIANILTQEEIDNAEAIILGVDREVDMSRFAGKKIYKTGTKKIIADAAGIINKALAGEGLSAISTSVKSTGGASATQGEGEMSLENFGARSWKAVMNGVSYMLPFVIFGGIFIAMSFLIDTMAGYGDAGGALGTSTGIAAFFNGIGGVSMGLMVPILTGYIMFGLIGRPGLLPGIVIGMLAAGNGPIFTTVFGIYPATGVPSWLTDIQPGFEGTVAASGFIGGIVGAFWGTVVIVITWNILCKLPASLRGINQILLLPLLGTGIAAISFWFLNIPLIYLSWGLLALLSVFDNMGITPILALLLAAMMATDMGGPINKTAYVFGTVMMGLAATNPEMESGYVYMAAVMAGGMVPPLAIAIATLFGRETLWDNADKDGGITNWVMGASFITEGAIPFASKYPKAVMPGIIAGSAVAGLIVGIFGIGIGAPHGGIFVIALSKATDSGWINLGASWLAAIMWLVAIIAGALVSAITIVAIRKKQVSINA